METFKTRKELAAELGVTPVTLWRKVRDVGMKVPKGRLCPNTYHEIKRRLGFEEPRGAQTNQNEMP
jgi:predicted transcriptional regulator